MAKIDRAAGRPRRRPVTLPAALAAALLLTVPACGSGAGGDNSPSAHGRTESARPHPSPTPVWDTRPDSVAALGDSITAGFDACGLLADCTAASWATGTDPAVHSLASRLVANPSGHTWNFARTGALMVDLPRQIDRAIPHKPELVTILVGANDACRNNASAMTSTADFRAGFRTSLQKLRKALPTTQVYVAAVPDLLRLWSQGRQNPVGKQVWQLGICQSMLRDADDLSSTANNRRAEVRDQVVAYNEALREVCETDRRCRFDQAVFDYRFTGRELSEWDWFHPSKRGQRELAEMAYRTVTRAEGRS
ncbi:SGNH/GDSL hydrolase family protein [Streptomyces niger]|uniref:SGNH/GDSL hydrolase family protein n=1 Tax=Streptomyces niger TaxID=66373 RepID=UPI000A8A94DC|nr:SGNH/GDSL hydrolase family protein [Streptomyces niger]